MTHRWDYRSSPYVRMGFWLLLIVAGLALKQAGQTEVMVYTRGEGRLEVGTDRLFKVKLPESDLAKVQVGMPAMIGWTAYPRAQYGLSQGSIQSISVSDEHTLVMIKLDSPVLKSQHLVQPLQPGLSGTVQIVLDRKQAIKLLWDWVKGF